MGESSLGGDRPVERCIAGWGGVGHAVVHVGQNLDRPWILWALC